MRNNREGIVALESGNTRKYDCPMRRPDASGPIFGHEVEECRDRVLEILNFLQKEFLRVWINRGIKTEDLPNALASLAVSAIDSLKAVMLLSLYDDFNNAHVMFRRYEEHFAWMLYLIFCDDGTLLKRWFEKPHLIPSEKNHKIRSAVAKKTSGFFHLNPFYDFKGNFDDASRRSVHVTWCSVQHAAMAAMSRHAANNLDMDKDGSFRKTLEEVRAIEFLGVVGPVTTRFLEFLTKKLFKMPEFSEVSPGEDILAEAAGLTVIWWGKIEQRMREMERTLT